MSEAEKTLMTTVALPLPLSSSATVRLTVKAPVTLKVCDRINEPKTTGVPSPKLQRKVCVSSTPGSVKEPVKDERNEFHDILNNTVLESGKFQKINFVSTAVSDAQKSGETRSFTLSGELKLRGATRRVSFPVKATVTKAELRATGEAKLKQTDFGITPYSGKLGLIKIGDEVKISFSIVAKP